VAHAQFHKNQRVYVRPVGTWAIVERVVPHWTKGLEEPLRIYYDVGLGREFSAEELQAEAVLPSPEADGGEAWRILRVPNRWQAPAETTTHPFPGTYPVVLTGEAEWGGWRVPGAEYALSPARIERQARVMASAPRLVDIVRQLALLAKETPESIPESVTELMRRSGQAMTFIDESAE
jgi:hypothetical protein